MPESLHRRMAPGPYRGDPSISHPLWSLRTTDTHTPRTPRRRFPLLTQSTEVAGDRGHSPSTSENAARLLPASGWNLPQLPGRRPTRMPERGEFQARLRPLPAGPCPSGHFKQRATGRRTASLGGGRASRSTGTHASHPTLRGTAGAAGHREACQPGLGLPGPPSRLRGTATQAPPGSSSVVPGQGRPGHGPRMTPLPRQHALCAAGTASPVPGGRTKSKGGRVVSR